MLNVVEVFSAIDKPLNVLHCEKKKLRSLTIGTSLNKKNLCNRENS